MTQQILWHTMVDNIWDRMRETNLPPDSFVKHMDHFQLNLDKICIMANDGSLMIIGLRDRKKHENRLDDSRLSLTLIIIGNAAGNEGPWIFIYKINSNTNKSLSDAVLVSQHGTPVGSHFHPTPNEYFTDDA